MRKTGDGHKLVSRVVAQFNDATLVADFRINNRPTRSQARRLRL
jgi:hypothetical protein